MASTMQEALVAELLGDVGTLHDEIKALPAAIHEAVGAAPAAIRDATSNAIANIEKVAEAQTYWIDQETLKDRDAFLSQQKAVNDSFVAEMKALMAIQDGTLERILLRAGAVTTAAIKREVADAVAAGAAGIAADAQKAAASKAGFGIAGVLTVAFVGAVFGCALVIGMLFLRKFV